MQEELKNKITISVVIPVFNGGKFLAQTLDSILGVDEINLLEIIVIDDGSTDDTNEIIQSYQSKFSRFKYFSQQREGVAKARNKGLELSTGEFIAFLDADDIWLRNHLSHKIIFLNKNLRAFAVTSYCEIINEKGEPSHEIKKGDSSISLNDVLRWRGNYITIPSGILFRRAHLLEFGGFNPNLSNNADQEIIMRLLSKNLSFHTLSEVTWQYRKHSQNMSSNIELLESDTVQCYQLAIKNGYFSGRLLKQECLSKMALIIGLSWWKNENNWAKALPWILKSFLYSPVKFVDGVFTRLFGVRNVGQ